MAHPRLTALVLLLVSTASLDGWAQATGAGGRTRLDPAFEDLLRSGAGRGNKLLKMTAETVRDEGCRTLQLPFLRLVGSEVYPARAAPGRTLNHRMIYALCPARPGTTLTATLTKRLFSSDRLILDEPNTRYQFRPGTWADDDEIVVPLSAPKGKYTMEIEIALGTVTQSTRAEFSIE